MDFPVREIYKEELTWDLPIEFEGISISPIKMKDVYLFYNCVDVLIYNQLQYPDLQIATMSRLGFMKEMYMISKTDPENQIAYILIKKFEWLLTFIFGQCKYSFVDPEHPKRTVLRVAKANEDGGFDEWITLNNKKFEMFRKIILEQNGVKYCDEFVHESIRKNKERAALLKRRSKQGEPEIEDLVDIAFMYTGKDYDFIREELSVRKFNRLLQRIGLFEEYKICKTGEMSGMVKFKSEIPRWDGSLATAEEEFKDMNAEVAQYKNKLKSI